MAKQKVSFATQCYQGDYKNVLDKCRLQLNINNNNYEFNEKIMIVNISNNYEEIIDLCEDLVNDGVLTNYYLVRDYLDDICNHFKIKKEDFSTEKSFYLNLYNLGAIYLSKSDYIVFYTGDSVCVEKSDWIEKSAPLLNESSNLCSCQPWSTQIITEYYKEEGDFYYSKASFSDQNYMFKKNIVMNPDIIKYKSPKEFPHGDTFEMRIHGFMLKFNLNKLIYKRGRYEHKNFQ